MNTVLPSRAFCSRSKTTASGRAAPLSRRPVDPVLEELLRGAVAIGVLLLVLLPAARGTHAQFGWLPLWLLAMPLSAWWALHGFRLPARARVDGATAARRRPQSVPQARRWVRPRLPGPQLQPLRRAA